MERQGLQLRGNHRRSCVPLWGKNKGGKGWSLGWSFNGQPYSPPQKGYGKGYGGANGYGDAKGYGGENGYGGSKGESKGDRKGRKSVEKGVGAKGDGKGYEKPSVMGKADAATSPPPKPQNTPQGVAPQNTPQVASSSKDSQATPTAQNPTPEATDSQKLKVESEKIQISEDGFYCSHSACGKFNWQAMANKCKVCSGMRLYNLEAEKRGCYNTGTGPGTCQVPEPPKIPDLNSFTPKDTLSHTKEVE